MNHTDITYSKENNIARIQRLGHLLKYLRNETKVSQATFCICADIDTSYYCQIENGRYNPTLLHMNKICTYLDVPLSRIIYASFESDISDVIKAYNHELA